MNEERPGDEPIGSVGDEAAKLLGALGDWARDHGPGQGQGEGLGHGWGEAFSEHLANGAPECTWCPVCRTVHVLREASPEVRAHLGVAAASLMQAAAGILASVAADQPRHRPGPVEHIDLDDPDTGPDTGPDTDPNTDHWGDDA